MHARAGEKKFWKMRVRSRLAWPDSIRIARIGGN